MDDQQLSLAEYRMLSTTNAPDGLDRIGITGTPHGIVGHLQQDCGPSLYIKFS